MSERHPTRSSSSSFWTISGRTPDLASDDLPLPLAPVRSRNARSVFRLLPQGESNLLCLLLAPEEDIRVFRLERVEAEIRRPLLTDIPQHLARHACELVEQFDQVHAEPLRKLHGPVECMERAVYCARRPDRETSPR